MMSNKITVRLAAVLICSVLLMSGCSKPAMMALKFTPQDSASYRVRTLNEDSVKFEGESLKSSDLKDRSNSRMVEMVFEQRIQNVDDKGNATARITIKGLKYLDVVKGSTVIDFNSSRQSDSASPLSKLIGQGYTIEITPAGLVSKVTDTADAIAAAGTGSSAARAASDLLSPAVVTRRHSICELPKPGSNQLKVGQSWTNTKGFSFGLMGSKSYEKIYTLKDVKDVGGHRIATAEMKTIPAQGGAEQLRDERSISMLAKMFDTTDAYSGVLELDLNSGSVVKYSDELRSQWVAVEPPEEQKGGQPAVIRMNSVRLHAVDKVN